MIENDFKEKYRIDSGYQKNISNYTKDEFITLLHECGIIGLSGSNIKTYKKYSKNVNYLIVNAVECEPCCFCDKLVINKYTEKILECIDAIIEINKIKYAVIAVKENDPQSIGELSKYIGSYPKIKIVKVPDRYPIGYDKFLIEYIFGKKVGNLAEKKGIVVNNVSTILAIHDVLKYCRPLTERIISITGNGIKREVNVKAKIGSSLQEIISNVTEYKKNKKLLFIVNGSMRGKGLPTDDVVVSKDLKSVLVVENKYYKTSNCINCGKCAEVCPSKIYPSLIMKNVDDPKKINILHPDKCINCGLCSYVCPSKIELNEYIQIAKRKKENDEF